MASKRDLPIRKRMAVGLQQPVQLILITTKFVSSNLAHCGVYLKQFYVIKFIND